MRNKVRLDCLMVEQGCAESREKAKAIIMAGDVFIQNQRYDKPGMLVRKIPSWMCAAGCAMSAAAD